MTDKVKEELNKILKEHKVNELTNSDWIYISYKQTFSENFIREFKDKVSWYWISCYQTLSENFIREFKNKVDWEWISCKQNLSKKFLKEFKNKLDVEALKKNKHITKEYIVYMNYVSRFDLMIIE